MCLGIWLVYVWVSGIGSYWLGTWRGLSDWLEECKGFGVRLPMVSPAFPQGLLALSTLFSSQRSYTCLSWAPSQSGHSSARVTLKASDDQLSDPGRWEVETQVKPSQDSNKSNSLPFRNISQRIPLGLPSAGPWGPIHYTDESNI